MHLLFNKNIYSFVNAKKNGSTLKKKMYNNNKTIYFPYGKIEQRCTHRAFYAPVTNKSSKKFKTYH